MADTIDLSDLQIFVGAMVFSLNPLAAIFLPNTHFKQVLPSLQKGCLQSISLVAGILYLGIYKAMTFYVLRRIIKYHSQGVSSTLVLPLLTVVSGLLYDPKSIVYYATVYYDFLESSLCLNE